MAGELVPRPNNPPVDITFAEQRQNKALNKLSFYGEIIDAAQQKLCSLYGKSPSSVIKTQTIGEIFDPGAKGILDNTCQDVAPPPPPPQPPFSGGQCPTQYDVNVTINGYVMDGGNRENRSSSGSTIVTGDILNVFKFDAGPLSGTGVPGARRYQIRGYAKGSNNPVTDPGAPSGYSAFVVAGNDNFFYENHSVSVVRRDGQADNCGSLAPQYPPPSATVPDMEGTTIINIAPNVPITVPVKIVPTFAPTVGIFRPEFNVEVGGINVNISTGGFTLSPTIEIAPNINVPYNDPRTTKPNPVPITPPSSKGADCDLTPVLDKLKSIQKKQEECCDDGTPPKDPDEANTNQTPFGSANSATVALPVDTFKVVLTMVTQPEQEKKQFGDNASDVIYAGWARFKDNDSKGERQPVDANSLVFRPQSSGYKSFEFKLYTGYNAIVTAYSKKPKPT